MITPPAITSSNEMSDSSLYSLYLTLICICIFLFIITLIIFILVRKKKNSGYALIVCILWIPCAIACYVAMPKKVQATLSDIYASMSDELTLDVQFIIQPKKDIEDLKLNFIFKDSQGRILDQQQKEIGDVKQNNQYVVAITLNEFTFSQFMQIHSWSLEVIGGTIYK